MSLSVARQLLGRVLNDRQGDAEKNTPETEWRRQRDLQVRLGVIGKALVAVIDELELHQSSTEEAEEIEEELRKLLLTIDPTGSITNYNSGPGSGNPGSPGSPGGGARVTLSLVRLLGNVFVRSKDDEGVLELLRGALHHVGSRLDGLGRDIQVVAASGGGGGSVDNPMTSDLDAGGYKITNYGTPSAAGDVTDKAYVDAADAVLAAAITAGDALAIPKSLVDAKGDLLVGTASDTVARLAVASNVRALVADSSATEGVAWGGGVDNFIFASTSTFDLRFDGAHTQAALTTFTPTADRLYAYPVWVKRPCVIDRLGYEVTTVGAGGGKVRLGIYKASSSTDPKPGTLITDSGEFSGADVESTGMKEKTISVSILEPGLYWFAFDVNSSAGGSFAVRALAAAATIPVLGMDSTGGGRNPGLYRPYSFAALPDPFAGTLTTRSGAMPQVYVRYSSAT